MLGQEGPRLGILLSTVVQVLVRGGDHDLRDQGAGQSHPVNRVGEFSLYLGCEQREVTSVPRIGLIALKGARPDLWELVGFGLQGQEPNRGE